MNPIGSLGEHYKALEGLIRLDSCIGRCEGLTAGKSQKGGLQVQLHACNWVRREYRAPIFVLKGIRLYKGL